MLDSNFMCNTHLLFIMIHNIMYIERDQGLAHLFKFLNATLTSQMKRYLYKIIVIILYILLLCYTLINFGTYLHVKPLNLREC